MKKLTRLVQKVNAPVLGLDIHKDLIVYCLLDREGNEVEAGAVGGTTSDLEALVDRLVGRRKLHAAFEATGGILWIFDLLVARLGRQRVHVAQPRRIRAIANSREKNDANDAWWLADLTHEGRLPESFIPTGALRELRIATRVSTRPTRSSASGSASTTQMQILDRVATDLEDDRPATPALVGDDVATRDQSAKFESALVVRLRPLGAVPAVRLHVAQG